MLRPPDGVPPAGSAVDHRLVLIGDAGDPDPDGEPTLRALEAHVRQMPERTTVVFLGDNVYETGMPDATPLEGTRSRRSSTRRCSTSSRAGGTRSAA
jgi:hypothetical protein